MGERRRVTRFAWWPTELSNGDTVWLESYLSVEKWGRGFDTTGSWGCWLREMALPLEGES